jgi:hypothetical protein
MIGSPSHDINHESEVTLDGEHLLMLEHVLFLPYSTEYAEQFSVVLVESAKKLVELIALTEHFDVRITCSEQGLIDFKESVLDFGSSYAETLRNRDIKNLPEKKCTFFLPESFISDLQTVQDFFECHGGESILLVINFLSLSVFVEECDEKFVVLSKKQKNGWLKVLNERHVWEELATDPKLPLFLSH